MHKTDAPNRIGRALVLGACAALLLAGCKTEVYRGLTETQANAMMAVLLKNGIEPEKTSDKEGYAIAVESDRVTQTLELMRENNLPRSEFDTMGDVFAAKGMISSATEEKARMTYALSQELSDTFSRIDGVLTARVHVVLQTEDLATGKTTPASAAVFLRHTPDSQAPGLVARIRELAANAVPGLSSDRVSVMLVPVRETITVPMLEEESAKSDFPLLYGALGALIVGLGALAGAVVLYLRAKAQKGAAKSSESSARTGERV